MKADGYQRRITLGKASPGGLARRQREVDEFRNPWVNAVPIVGDNKQKRQSDIGHEMHPLCMRR